VVFARHADLQAIYDRLTRAAMHTVKPDHIATFLGRKLHGNYQDEMGNRFNTHIEGTRIQHTMGPVSIQMYDQFRLILRIETTVDHVSFFQHRLERLTGAPRQSNQAPAGQQLPTQTRAGGKEHYTPRPTLPPPSGLHAGPVRRDRYCRMKKIDNYFSM
jgi:hypothetical protein